MTNKAWTVSWRSTQSNSPSGAPLPNTCLLFTLSSLGCQHQQISSGYLKNVLRKIMKSCPRKRLLRWVSDICHQHSRERDSNCVACDFGCRSGFSNMTWALVLSVDQNITILFSFPQGTAPFSQMQTVHLINCNLSICWLWIQTCHAIVACPLWSAGGHHPSATVHQSITAL